MGEPRGEGLVMTDVFKSHERQELDRMIGSPWGSMYRMPTLGTERVIDADAPDYKDERADERTKRKIARAERRNELVRDLRRLAGDDCRLNATVEGVYVSLDPAHPEYRRPYVFLLAAEKKKLVVIPREAPEFAETMKQQGVTVIVAAGRSKRRTLAEIVAALKARFGPSPEIQPEVTGAPQSDVRAMDLND